MKRFGLLVIVLSLAVLTILLSSCFKVNTDASKSSIELDEQKAPSSTEEKLVLPEIEAWLDKNACDIIKISIEDRDLGACTGGSLAIEETYYINEIVKLLCNLKLQRITDEEAQNIDKSRGLQTTVYFYSSDNGAPMGKLRWVNGYILDDNGAYYRCDGEFVDTNFISNRFLQAVYSIYPDAKNGFSGRSISLTDSSSYLWVYVIHPTKDCENMALGSENVAGYGFEYPQNYRIIVFYHDEIYSLTNAYECGLIDESDIKEIHIQYPEKLAILQK